jgi:hypothetical protein
MFRNSTLKTLALAAAAGFAIAAPFTAPASAALLAYDPFTTAGGPSDYLAGDDSTGVNVLGGQNPAIGPTAFYNGGWIQSGGDAQAVTAGNSSLLYPLFPNAGGRVMDSLQFSCCSFGRDGREIAGGLGGGRTARTIYQSFLIDFGSQGTDDPTQFGLRGYEMWNGGVGDSFIAVSLYVNHFGGVNDFRLEVTTASGETFAELDGGGVNLANFQGTHLMVLKFEFDPVNPDVVTLFVDPTDSIEGNWTPSAVVSAPNSDLLITHHGTHSNFTFSGGGHIPGAFDEVRWGDTFADVTPFLDPSQVPAPASLSLFFLGVAGMAAARRRFGRAAR